MTGVMRSEAGIGTAQLGKAPTRSLLRRVVGRVARNRLALAGGIFLLVVALAALFAPAVARYDPEDIDLANRLKGPSATHWFGTDETGRDTFARLLHGGRVSLTVGLTAIAIAVGIGTLAGAVAGYFGGAPDALIMRIADGMLAIPIFFFLLIVLAVYGPTLVNIVAAIGLTSWMGVARIVRSEVLRTRHLDYVTAARALGAGNARVIARHVLPQATGSIIVACTLGVAQAILLESALSYLGLGIQPPQSSWGNMLSGAQAFVFTAPQLAIYPGVAILVTVLAFNALGDGLRDALDPTESGFDQ